MGLIESAVELVSAVLLLSWCVLNQHLQNSESSDDGGADSSSVVVADSADAKAGVSSSSDLESLRPRMLRIVKFRMDARLASRVDAGDVVQEAFIEAWRRIDEFDSQRGTLVVWLRFLVVQKLVEFHRRHLGVQARDVRREVNLTGPSGDCSSVALAARLVGSITSPSSVVAKAEMRLQVQDALKSLDEIDCEILMLRHFEQFSNAEAAEILGIAPTAACNRLVRALERLYVALKDTSLQNDFFGQNSE